MKRHSNLWDGLVSFTHLLSCAHRAARGKRNWANVARFLLDLENQLLTLQQELQAGTYRPGDYQTFTIHEPKKRLISAAPFRDRVVHHALCAVLEPIYEKTFIPDSYASRKGKGTHAAIQRFTQYARRHRYVLKGDVQKYFPSIDHGILKDLLTRKIKDRRVLALATQIIDHSNPQEPVQDWYPGDDLLTPGQRRRGLPLGNQTSQFFANIYLNPFDHWVREVLRAPGYVRYVDDFALFANDKAWLAHARQRCRQRLASLRLRLHPHKSVISPVATGTPFLGYRIFPTHRLLPWANLTRMRRRLRRLQTGYASGALTWEDVRKRLAGWLGHALQADTFHLRRHLFEDMVWHRREHALWGGRS